MSKSKFPRYSTGPKVVRHNSGQTPAARARSQAKYNSKPEQIKRRAGRNKARAIAEKAGKVHKGDGKDVDHRNGNALDESAGNLRVLPKSTNRKYNRRSQRTKLK